MADVAKRLFGPALVSNAAATKYTAGAGVTATLRHVRVTNGSAADAKITASIGADAAGTRGIFAGESVPAGGSIDWSGFMVLAAGEIIQAFSDTNNVLVLTGSGVETT
jgi:hypothetical protein